MGFSCNWKTKNVCAITANCILPTANCQLISRRRTHGEVR
jgi:hypothetical protein